MVLLWPLLRGWEVLGWGVRWSWTSTLAVDCHSLYVVFVPSLVVVGTVFYLHQRLSLAPPPHFFAGAH